MITWQQFLENKEENMWWEKGTPKQPSFNPAEMQGKEREEKNSKFDLQLSNLQSLLRQHPMGTNWDIPLNHEVIDFFYNRQDAMQRVSQLNSMYGALTEFRREHSIERGTHPTNNDLVWVILRTPLDL